ncbi:MAG: cation diffusion facilitator family transporter [Solirubrobacteraceae bacterium]
MSAATPREATPAHHALALALAANAAAALVKLAAFAVTGASVLLAEGLHSMADCGNQGALLLGHRGAGAAPTARYPLGKGRVRYLWAFLVAVVVFGGSALISFAEATYRLLHPGHSSHLSLTLGALGLAVAIEAVSIISAVRETRPLKGDQSWTAFVAGSRDPDLPVLIVEDVADLVGLGLALAGTLVVELTGAAVIDAVASYLIGLVLAANAVFLAREMASLVLGESADAAVEQAVLAAISAPVRAVSVQVTHLGRGTSLSSSRSARRQIPAAATSPDGSSRRASELRRRPSRLRHGWCSRCPGPATASCAVWHESVLHFWRCWRVHPHGCAVMR